MKHVFSEEVAATASSSAVGSSLTLAELCIQRGDYKQARELLQLRYGRGTADFQTRNLLGISLAQLNEFDQAAALFQRLSTQERKASNRNKALFNLALVDIFRTLDQVGDCAIAVYPHGIWGMPAQQIIQPLKDEFRPAIEILERLSARSKVNRDLTLAFLAFAFHQSGNYLRALDSLRESLDLNENLYVTHYVLGRVFLDLFFLDWEESPCAIPEAFCDYYEIEPSERKPLENTIYAYVSRDALLDITLNAFWDARQLMPLSIEIVLWLGMTYVIAGAFEEAQEMVATAQAFASDLIAVWELTLLFQQTFQQAPESIPDILRKIREMRHKKDARPVHMILPPYYLF